MPDGDQRALMSPTDIRDAFIARGWVRGAGGDLYFNGKSTAAHPHLHLKVASMVGGPRPQIGGDIRIAVTMLAYSDGPPIGGQTFISESGNWVRHTWKETGQAINMSAATREEYAWIMSYFVYG